MSLLSLQVVFINAIDGRAIALICTGAVCHLPWGQSVCSAPAAQNLWQGNAEMLMCPYCSNAQRNRVDSDKRKKVFQPVCGILEGWAVPRGLCSRRAARWQELHHLPKRKSKPFSVASDRNHGPIPIKYNATLITNKKDKGFHVSP